MTTAVQEALTVDKIQEVLVELTALDDGDDSVTTIDWSGKNAKNFLEHPAIFGVLPQTTPNQLKKLKTAQAIYDLINTAEPDEKEEVPTQIPTARTQTVFPRGLVVTYINVPIKEEVIKVTAKIDAERNLPDAFRTDDLNPSLAYDFDATWNTLCEHVCKHVKAFKGINITITKMRQDTLGKGDKKKAIFKFEAVDPTNPDKNHSYHSGEVPQGTLPVEFYTDLREFEYVVDLIYRREVLVEDRVNQMDVGSAIISAGSDGGEVEGNDDAQEPLDV